MEDLTDKMTGIHQALFSILDEIKSKYKDSARPTNSREMRDKYIDASRNSGMTTYELKDFQNKS